MKIEELPKGKQVILFDGVCNLCNATINKIVDHDPKNVFVFATLQSEIGKEIRNHIGLSSTTDSIVLYQPGVAYYVKSEAVLKIASQLSGLYPLIGAAKILPTFFADQLYDMMAKNRYRWFGKNESCRIPTPEIQSKFL